jgi:hypothetical protein
MALNATRLVLPLLAIAGIGLGVAGAGTALAKNPYPNPLPPPYLVALTPAVANSQSQATVTIGWFGADASLPARVIESHVPADDQVQQFPSTGLYGQTTATVYCNETNKYELVDASFNPIVPSLIVQVQGCPLNLGGGLAQGLACAIVGNCDPTPAPPIGRAGGG